MNHNPKHSNHKDADIITNINAVNLVFSSINIKEMKSNSKIL